MQRSPRPEPSTNVEMNLREQLLGHGPPAAASASSLYPPIPQQSSAGTGRPYRSSKSTSPHEPSAESGPAGSQYATQMSYSMSNDSGPEDGLGDSRKGKRELSTSKRAAQNRAAQRAFRQRKESYIKKLEDQVQDFQTMEQDFRSLQNENYQLREYILNLQSRLLETRSDIPPPPLQVSLQQGTASSSRRDPAQSESKPETLEAEARPQTTYPPSTTHTVPPKRPTESSYIERKPT